jgi:hypothetical protein
MLDMIAARREERAAKKKAPAQGRGKNERLRTTNPNPRVRQSTFQPPIGFNVEREQQQQQRIRSTRFDI